MIFFKNKKTNTQKTDKGIKRLKMFSGILFFLFLFFLILNIATTRKGLFYLSKKHIAENNQINTAFLGPYIDAGFTEDESMTFITGDELKNFVAKVMSDRYYSIFHDVREFTYDMENGKEEISEILLKEIEKLGITIPDISFMELTDYTMDITGVSTMLASSTPEMYINYIFNLNNQTEDTVLGLSGISSVISFITVVIFFAMYVISFVILCLLSKDVEKMPYYLSNTMFCPSVFILGLSIGEVFGFETDIIAKYIFEIGILVGILGILGSIAILFFAKHFLQAHKKI